jgi:hypothetical protein
MKMKHLVWLLLISSLVLHLACAPGTNSNDAKALSAGENASRAKGEPPADGKQSALNEEFKLLPHEKLAIKDTGLTVQVDKVLRSWYVNGKSDTVSVEFTTTLDGKEEKQYLDFEKKFVTVGEFRIELLAADPFGKNECKFKVTRRER